ncbi:MAG: LpxL/LpxP family acyltransferase [Planctomycetota bacterium]
MGRGPEQLPHSATSQKSPRYWAIILFLSMVLRLPWRFFRRRPAGPTGGWVATLDEAQRRTLARNLRRIVESKSELERRLNKTAHPR